MIGRYFLGGLVFGCFLVSCNNNKADETVIADNIRIEKFEPADGKVILFVGQELEAIGGMDKYNDGYFDYFPAAASMILKSDYLH
ncbi:MAG: hypothetical protein ABI480_10055 [Chitinophagaceae bacterium]